MAKWVQVKAALNSHKEWTRNWVQVTKDLPARFGRLRAVGAFLISSEYKAGNVQYVCIESEKGRDCTVLNPWPGKKVTLFRNGDKTDTLTGKQFKFKTAKDEKIWLGPQGISFDQLANYTTPR